MSKRISIEGKKFNRWTVIKYEYNKQNHSFYLAKCDCGTERIVSGNYLRRGTSKSCGCYQDDQWSKSRPISRINYIIGNLHHSMMQRCYWSKHKSWHRYGGRGIFVCKEWHNKRVFKEFLLSNDWRQGLQIDRINNDGNYESSNVRLVTRSENTRNSTTMTIWKNKRRNAKGQWMATD